jgi:uncharacterized cupredoxin-like copper-binding protein
MRFTSLRRSLALFAATVALGTLAVAPAVAQSPAPAAGGTTITVTATDHAFNGLPTSVPAGTALALDNQGAEVHELLVARKKAGVTESWDELLALPDAEAIEKVDVFGPIVAEPGAVAEGTIVLAEEGEYIALCFVPQGMTAIPSGPPAPDASFGPPHVMLGMRQEFMVTAAGTEVGPLPSAGTPSASAPAAEARVIELDANAALQFTDKAGTQIKEIAVTPGETITFKVTNTAGYQHNFYIGTDQQLMNAANAEMVGIPDFSEGTQEVTWTVPADITGLKFGCTVPGHYQIMQGTFVAAS